MNDVHLTNAKIGVVLNTASGSYTADAKEKLVAILAKHQIPEPTVWETAPSDIESAFTELVAFDPDVLIVLAGDGTIRFAAESCLDRETLLIPLPGGTMNMLPKALYGDRSWERVLEDTLQAPRVRTISSGQVGEHQFFIAAIVGTPTLWTHAREALREGDVQGVIEHGTHALQNMLASKVRYIFSPENTGEAAALTVLCPLISTEMDDNERSLEAAVIDVESAGDVLALATTAAFGAWRESEKVSVVKTRSVTITADETVPIILDGESMELGNSLEITFVPKAFKALVPAA